MPRSLIGARIRERRRSLGMTQSGLAATIGISASYLNLIERNKRNIGGALLKRIAGALGLALDELDGAAGRRLLDDLGELAGDSRLAALRLDPSGIDDLAGRHPGWRARSSCCSARCWIATGRSPRCRTGSATTRSWATRCTTC